MFTADSLRPAERWAVPGPSLLSPSALCHPSFLSGAVSWGSQRGEAELRLGRPPRPQGWCWRERREPHARQGQQPPRTWGSPHFWLLFLLSPEKPHLNLWLEAPDLLLAEIDLPKLVGAPST